jgi:hypothetical protein
VLEFANPGMLWALALALAPVLLHLLRRRAAPLPVVPFSDTRLLESAARQVKRRRRIREWLLLSVRVTLLAAAALAFARPSLPADTTGPDGLPRPAPSRDPSAVSIVASATAHLEAALGYKPVGLPDAAARLLFAGDDPAMLLQESGARSLGVQSGQVNIAPGPYFHPALRVFDQPGQGDLRAVRVWRWWKLQPKGRTVVLARLSNGDPFLLEQFTDRGRTIICALSPEPAWTDLPLHPQFVALTRELVGYLRDPPGPLEAPAAATAVAHGTDLTGTILAVAALLAVAELWLSGAAIGKLLALGLLLIALAHPTFAWQRERAADTSLLIVADLTDSMQFRAEAVAAALDGLPGGERVTLRGDATDLGAPLRALTNRAFAAAALVSDGQHNRGVSPAWIAAQLPAPVFTYAAGPPAPPRDVSLAALEAPAMVWSGEVARVTATVRADGYEDARLTATLTANEQVLAQTNVAPGRLELAFRPSATGRVRHELRIAPLPGEVTDRNNAREFQIAVRAERIRVFIEAEAPDWEFLHIRHAMRRDPAVELVTERARADVVVSAAGQTWRLRGHRRDLFQQYWSRRARQHWWQTLAEQPAPGRSEELYALWRNDGLLEEIARVSAGEFFTDQQLERLAERLRQHQRVERAEFDLRDSALALLALAAGFILSWCLRPTS